mmetsp:Transcript_28372/g.59278  ORF Transcript_28372/g.59278 Transcript_28372/m.59278 type:complete len:205 (-) Transcript_28372:4583-5197(-)
MKPRSLRGLSTLLGRSFLPTRSSRSFTLAAVSGAGLTPMSSFSSGERAATGSFAASALAFFSVSMARLKSRGKASTNLGRLSAHLDRISAATVDLVRSRCSSMRPRSSATCSGSVTGPYSFLGSSSLVHLPTASPLGSHRYARPPDMPAAKLSPMLPSTTTRPPVMYSHPWSPVPSTTAHAPELRTANRSAAIPRAKKRPPVAP